VEDHAEPVDELRRLVAIHRAYRGQLETRSTLLDEPTLRERLFAPFRP
jgi:hypothetical protein